MRRKEDIGVLLKGDIKIQAGIPFNKYANIHTYLRRNYGAANKCENPDCTGKSKCYHYALKKGREYEKVRSSFIMLCASCHMKYDWDIEKRRYLWIVTDEKRQKISKGMTGKKRTQESRDKQSKSVSGTRNPMYGVRITGENNHFYGKHHTEETKHKLSLARAVLTEETVLEIRVRHRAGEMQKDIAASLHLSRPLICKIIKGNRYRQWQ